MGYYSATLWKRLKLWTISLGSAAKYEAALEKFETVLGLKPEAREEAVASYNVACCYSQLKQVKFLSFASSNFNTITPRGSECGKDVFWVWILKLMISIYLIFVATLSRWLDEINLLLLCWLYASGQSMMTWICKIGVVVFGSRLMLHFQLLNKHWKLGLMITRWAISLLFTSCAANSLCI